MKITPSEIPEVLIIEPQLFGDTRGFFMETWNKLTYSKNGLQLEFVQDNFSRSIRGVLRGLHYQLDNPQGKLIWVVSGKVFDVAVDIRQGSPTFGDWVGFKLTGEDHKQIYIPPGFAHGFCVLSDAANFQYKCTEFYHPMDEYGILWNDPDIGIEWPASDFVVSKKDAANPTLNEGADKLPVYNGPNR